MENKCSRKTTRIPDKVHLIIRTLVRANTGESLHVPETAEKIFRENQGVTVKFREYTFLVEERQCKQILLLHSHTKNPSTTNHITLQSNNSTGA